jgi:type II secretory pathway pseudopilin PulG
MKDKSQSGFSYIDVMIGLVIMMIGILAMMAAISWSAVQAAGHEQQLLAKQVATSTLESIMAVKETDPVRMGWPAVGNIGTNPDPATGINQGIFSVGFNPVRVDAGPDEVVGTPDDTGATVSQLRRRIVITDVCDPDRPSPVICNPAGTLPVRIRSVQITVTYNVGGLQRQERVGTVLTDYAVVN